MRTLSVKDFDLAATMRSGHIFAYDERADGSFLVCDGQKLFTVRQQDGKLIFTGDEGSVVRFFDLSLDVGALHRRLTKDPALRPVLAKYKGIRLVRQELRQAILTFILTANNNQKRIKGMVDRLRTKHGERDEGGHQFPLRNRIACTADIGDLGFGYRSRFIVETERKLTPGFLKTLKASPYAEARALLMTLPGVGPKVADCILAYSELASGEAFPADVWVKRAVAERYGGELEGKAFTDRNIQEWAREKFGKDAAYAQHYLFLAAQATRAASPPSRPRRRRAGSP